MIVFQLYCLLLSYQDLINSFTILSCLFQDLISYYLNSYSIMILFSLHFNSAILCCIFFLPPCFHFLPAHKISCMYSQQNFLFQAEEIDVEIGKSATTLCQINKNDTHQHRQQKSFIYQFCMFSTLYIDQKHGQCVQEMRMQAYLH